MGEDQKVVEADKNSALFLAMKEGNNKAVDLLMHYMSKTSNKSMEHFTEIYNYFIESQSFLQYIDSLPVQTQ